MKIKKNMFRYLTAILLVVALGLGVAGSALASSNSYISTDTVKEIAYEDAGVSSSKTAIDTLKLYRDGKDSYTFEFVFHTDTAKYVYKIDAYSGNILLSKDYKTNNSNNDKSLDANSSTESSISIEAENTINDDTNANITESSASDNTVINDSNDVNTAVSNSGNANTGNTNSLISSDNAFNIALSHAGVSSSSLKKSEVKLNNENNTKVYKVEFKTTNGASYEYKISAYTGEILKSENNGGNNKNTKTGNYISSEDAMNIVLAHSGVSSSSIKKSEVKLDEDNHITIYKIEIKTYSDSKYEYKINATTGAIIEYESK